eukprot:851832-Pyramimonas_sp.AAC.1
MREQAKQHDIIGFTESHQRGHRLQQARSDLGRDGWKLTATEATLIGRSSEGAPGGEWMISQKRLATTPFEHIREAERSRSRRDCCQGFAPMLWQSLMGN